MNRDDALRDLLDQLEAGLVPGVRAHNVPEVNNDEELPDGKIEYTRAGVNSASGWVRFAFLYSLNNKKVLGIEYRGAECVYPDTDEMDYFNLLAAPSAGEWVWANVYHSSYFQI